jgi:hypothetical protein
MTAQLLFPFCQRWQDRREVRRKPDVAIVPAEYAVEVIRDRDAKAFVVGQHYSGSYPAAHCAIGLFRRTGAAPARLVGVAVFSEGVQSHRAMPRWTGFDRSAGTELGRLVLSPEVPANGESWFIRRAFAALRAEKPRMRVVLSYADPVERLTEAGQVIKPGHFGTIYQASNALFLGRAEPRTLCLAPDGRVVHPYAFNKVADGRRGAAAAQRAILAAGCPPAEPGEEPAAWVARVRGGMRRLRHPGNLLYAFSLDDDARHALRAMHGAGLPYPKARDFQHAA